MLEHYTTAIVLKVSPKGEIDSIVTLYTKDFGKVIAKAKSLKKITSKLAGHLMPGNIVQIRLIEHGDGNGLQVLDALSDKGGGNIGDMLRFVGFIDKMTLPAMPDLNLWYEAEKAVRTGDFTPQRYRKVLGALGFGSESLICDDCQSNSVAYFMPRELIFMCADSIKKLNISEDDAVQI